MVAISTRCLYLVDIRNDGCGHDVWIDQHVVRVLVVLVFLEHLCHVGFMHRRVKWIVSYRFSLIFQILFLWFGLWLIYMFADVVTLWVISDVVSLTHLS